MKMNIRKTGMYCLGGIIGALPFLAMTPGIASAEIGWKPDDMLGRAETGNGNLTADKINQQSIFNWVQMITGWAFGIAVVLFALKVALTAIDRMVFDPDKGNSGSSSSRGGSSGGRSSGGTSVLSQIPIIGAYDPSMSWKEVWISFAKSVAIVAGVWVIIQILIGLIMFAFGQVTQV